jgi:hypothetical protein
MRRLGPLQYDVERCSPGYLLDLLLSRGEPQ